RGAGPCIEDALWQGEWMILPAGRRITGWAGEHRKRIERIGVGLRAAANVDEPVRHHRRRRCRVPAIRYVAVAESTIEAGGEEPGTACRCAPRGGIGIEKTVEARNVNDAIGDGGR